MACLDDNVRWINSPAEEGKPGGIAGLSAIIPWLGDFSTKAEVIATFGPWSERQETVRYERLNMMFREDQAMVLVHEAARIRATGLVYDIEFVQRIQVAGDLIVMLRAYWDTSQAVAAFRETCRRGCWPRQGRATPTKRTSSCRSARTRTRLIPSQRNRLWRSPRQKTTSRW